MFFGITNLSTYIIGAFLIILLPGPNSLYVLSSAAQHGVRHGYRAAAGVFVGDTVLMALTAAGAASLLRSSPLLFTIVKYAGAGYLAWIGFQMLRGAWRAWRSRPDTAEPVAAEAATPGRPPNPFRKALAISLLNPKAILFFVSFFIQFVDPGYGTPVLSFLILGAIIQVFSLLYLTGLIFGGTFLATQFRARRKLSAGLTSGVGALFLGFGAKLATTSLS
ncbi:leucine efflux protein LeuE [Nonomuraea guangzhouensis]|uniref:Leucine efflux protein LeuE n=1 Tax=Nonomuraea guangzhouensis TaxID=1291555 RepID=A0ABW4GCX5_9ACTN|nr:leucine efflux protein LeuE [Nonomuraea guangzhouensis]